MNIGRAFLGSLLVFGLLTPFSACKKSPTDTGPDINEPTIALVCNPTTGAKDEAVSASILIKGNTKEIRVFGLDVTFDPRMFKFQEVRKGTLTGGWAAVAGNEVEPGHLKVGGFVGEGAGIPVPSEGTLAEVLLKVTGEAYANGQQSQVCAQQYTDDLAEFGPVSVCSNFTLKK